MSAVLTRQRRLLFGHVSWVLLSGIVTAVGLRARKWELLVVAVGLFLTWILVAIPKFQTRRLAGADPTDRFRAEDQARKTLAQIAGGALLLCGLYVTWETLALSRMTQITERLDAAIQRLGNPDISVRVGAVYTLERIARGSAEDYWPIREMLARYVRERAPWYGRDNGTELDARELPAADVQTALTVLGRVQPPGKQALEGSPLRLMATDLRRANLEGADLRGAILWESTLEAANLAGADLEKADLRGTLLRNINPTTKISRGGRWTTSFRRADLGNADLEGASLVRANFESAFLADTKVRSALLQDAFLQCAVLQNADLSGANLARADLRGARLDGAILSGTRLWGADLRNAIGLTRRQLDEANVDETTRLPVDLTGEIPTRWEGCEATQ